MRGVKGTDSAGHPRQRQAILRDRQAMDVGRRLRTMRIEQGLSLDEVAAAAGLSRLWAAQIERCEILDLETTVTYARALGARLTICLEYRQG
jgi:hypothetical protein